ncbi:MAG: hypothetical protein KBC95_02110 [Candidatus Peribacteraceae bacterium]|nr:hypothetical protein [Candidatus Peribacteraceae bacterium]
MTIRMTVIGCQHARRAWLADCLPVIESLPLPPRIMMSFDYRIPEIEPEVDLLLLLHCASALLTEADLAALDCWSLRPCRHFLLLQHFCSGLGNAPAFRYSTSLARDLIFREIAVVSYERHQGVPLPISSSPFPSY